MSEREKPPVPVRATDAPDSDAAKLRDPLLITVNREELTAAFAHGRRRAAQVAAAIAIVTALLVASVSGSIVQTAVTNTVQKDVGHAAIVNCQHSTTVGSALNAFLTTDASFNSQLGALDRRSARIDRDLSRQIAKLGSALPARVAADYFAQARVFQELAAKREDIASLWAAPATGRGIQSLSQDVLNAIRGGCSNLLSP